MRWVDSWRFTELSAKLSAGQFADRQADPPRGGLSRLARRHAVFAVLFVFGLIFRAAVQLAYRPAILYVDTFKYLVTADQSDPVGYRVLLKPLDEIGGLGLVAAVQHLIGLGLAAGLYAMLIRRGLRPWLAALASAPVLLDAYQLQIEALIMPDLLFEALIGAGIILLAWDNSPRIWQIAAAGVLLGSAVTVRQIGETLIAPLVIFVMVATRGWTRRGIVVLTAVAAFAAPVVSYMGINDQLTGHFAITASPPDVLFGRTAYAADCSHLTLPRDERPFCPSSAFKAEVGGIDGLMHAPQSPLFRNHPPPGTTNQQLMADFSHRVLRQQPARVAASALRDAVRLFALTRNDPSPGTGSTIARWQFQVGPPLYYNGPTIQHLVRKYAGGHTSVSGPLARSLRAYQLHGGYTPGPVFPASLLAAVAGAAFCFRRCRPEASVCLLLLLTAVVVVGGSDFFEFSWRYQIPALVMLPAAGALGAALLAARLRARRAEPPALAP